MSMKWGNSRLCLTLALACILMSASSCRSYFKEFFTINPMPVDYRRELLVLDVRTVNDDRTNYKMQNGQIGPWSFGKLMADMAPNPADPSSFVLAWLGTWMADQDVNHFSSPKRTSMQRDVIGPWRAASGCPAQGTPTDGCVLDFSKAPFRLLAIVNRVDLGSTGEGRFVFCVTMNNIEQQFTVILEYSLPPTQSLVGWANAWHALGTRNYGSTQSYGPSCTDYNCGLEAITTSFATRAAMQAGQIRTNEDWLGYSSGDPRWEMREFKLAADGLLHQSPLKQTPDASFNNSQRLIDFLNANAAGIVTDTVTMDPTMLAASVYEHTPTEWTAVSDCEVMRRFAVNTCIGCHTTLETRTTLSTHIQPRPANREATISDFLAGAVRMNNPRCSERLESFQPLDERAQFMRMLVNLPDPGPGAPMPFIHANARVH